MAKNMARANNKKKGPAVSEANVDKYLCHCCVNLEICSFVKHSGKQVLYCEEFVGDDGSATETTYAMHEEVEDTGSILAVYAGLCATCDNCETCTLRKQEGGVWHCEEYK